MRKIEYSKEVAENIREWVLAGVTVKTMYTALDMSEDTFYKLYKADIAKARIEASMSVGKRIYNSAKDMDGDPKLAIHYSKTQLGWNDTSTIEVSVEDKGDKGGILAELAAKLGKVKKDDNEDQ